MVICPIAIAAGCQKCPVFKICPAKGIIGDQKSPDKAEADKPAKKSKSAPAKKS